MVCKIVRFSVCETFFSSFEPLHVLKKKRLFSEPIQSSTVDLGTGIGFILRFFFIKSHLEK